MRTIEGKVSAVEGKLATIEVTVHDGGCGRCHEVGGCGGQNITRAFCSKAQKITVDNTLNVRVGDQVSLGMEEQALRHLATRVYVLPFLGLIIGAGLGDQWFASANSAGGIFGGVMGFVLVLLWLSMCHSHKRSVPRMIASGQQAPTGKQLNAPL